MRYGSVCSGIEAATVAWHSLGWKPAFFSEIEAFPRAVLQHHYPDVPLHGDFTTIKGDEYGSIDLLVGGTPCQDFSVAGLRAGIAGERGNLTLEFLRLAARTTPRWIVWENVPGVLSSDGGRALGAFLGGLAQLGYGFAYRVLDAQYFGLAQRRARVFVVGCLGDWRRAAAVLFESESLQGHPAPRRASRERTAQTLAARTRGGGGLGTDAELDGALIAACETADTLSVGANQTTGFVGDVIAHTLKGEGHDASEDGTGRGVPLVPSVVGTLCESSGHARPGDNIQSVDYLIPAVAFGGNNRSGPIDVATAVNAHGGSHGRLDFESETFVAHAFEWQRGASQNLDILNDQSPALIKSQTPAVAFDTTQITSPSNYSNPQPGDPCHPLAAGAHPPAVAFAQRGREHGAVPEVHGDGSTASALRAASGGSSRDMVVFDAYNQTVNEVSFPLRVGQGNGSGDEIPQTITAMQVRRLTPRECERLQGFPDDYTLVPHRNKPAADGPRYKALGNSMAVPVMRWIGERIAMVEALDQSEAA